MRTGCAGYLLDCSQVHFSPLLSIAENVTSFLTLWLLSMFCQYRQIQDWGGLGFSLLQKSILNQWVALPFTWTHLSMLPALSFVLFSSQACLSFTLHQFQIPSFCNSQGDFYFLTGPWQTQGWLVVLNYNKTFYLLSSLQPPPFKEHKTGLCFFHIFYICGGIFWLFKYLC